MKWREYNPFGKKRETELEKQVDQLETILFALVEEMGYAVTIESSTHADWVYPELKKVKKDE